MIFEVFICLFKLRVQFLFACAADDSTPCAIAAVGSAAICNQKKNAVGITVNESGNRHVRVFAARIRNLEWSTNCLLHPGNDLTSDGAIWIVWVDQIKKMWGNGERELIARKEDAGPFFRTESDLAFELFEVGYPVFELPFPIVPELRCNIRPEAGSE